MRAYTRTLARTHAGSPMAHVLWSVKCYRPGLDLPLRLTNQLVGGRHYAPGPCVVTSAADAADSLPRASMAAAACQPTHKGGAVDGAGTRGSAASSAVGRGVAERRLSTIAAAKTLVHHAREEAAVSVDPALYLPLVTPRQPWGNSSPVLDAKLAVRVRDVPKPPPTRKPSPVPSQQGRCSDPAMEGLPPQQPLPVAVPRRGAPGVPRGQMLQRPRMPQHTQSNISAGVARDQQGDNGDATKGGTVTHHAMLSQVGFSPEPGPHRERGPAPAPPPATDPATAGTTSLSGGEDSASHYPQPVPPTPNQAPPPEPGQPHAHVPSSREVARLGAEHARAVASAGAAAAAIAAHAANAAAAVVLRAAAAASRCEAVRAAMHLAALLHATDDGHVPLLGFRIQAPTSARAALSARATVTSLKLWRDKAARSSGRRAGRASGGRLQPRPPAQPSPLSQPAPRV